MTAEILDIRERKRHLTAKRGFEPWKRRFGLFFDDDVSAGDLDDSVIRLLIPGDGESAAALYELAMGVLGLGAGPRFHFLDNRKKMAVMDLTLFLLDLFRFEAMKRLGWTEDFAVLHTPIVDLIEGFSTNSRPQATHGTPALSDTHPQYGEYMETFEGDKAAFVRKLIPEAIRSFSDSDGDM